MKKVCVIVMGRANWGRLKKLIEQIKNSKKLGLQLLIGASFYNANVDIEPDARIQGLCAGDDAESMVIGASQLCNRIAYEYTRLKPDIVFVHGDRFDTFPAAQAAYYMNIPIAHTEGGEDTGCIDDGIRNAITAFATYNFVVTEQSAVKLKQMGKQHVYVVGSTALDNLVDIKERDREKFILVLHHPNTSKDEDIIPLINALNRVSTRKIWVNPNIDAGSKKLAKLIHQESFEFVKDLSPDEYYKLLNTCELAIGNSSSFIKEGAFLGTPAVIVGDRQKDREHDHNVTFVACKADEIKRAIDIRSRMGFRRSTKFGTGDASKKIVNILEVL